MIIYEAEGVKFPNIKKRETTNWIRKVAASYGKKVGEIGYLFVDDATVASRSGQVCKRLTVEAQDATM